MDYVTREYEFVKVNRDSDGVVLVTYNNPKDLNAANLVMIRELGEILPQINADPAAKVVVFTGEGRAFASGGNMRALTDDGSKKADGPMDRPLWNVPNIPTAERLDSKQTTGLRVMRLIYEMEKPTIAAINGPAAGAGMDKALMCDIRIMASNTFMVSSYVRVGLVPFDGGMWLLPRIVGLGRAMEIMYTGRKLHAEECERIGLVNRVVESDQLMTESMALARQLAHGPGVSYQVIKHITQRCLTTDYRAGLDISYEARDVVFTTEDHKEGVRAFFERREPRFQGR